MRMSHRVKALKEKYDKAIEAHRSDPNNLHKSFFVVHLGDGDELNPFLEIDDLETEPEKRMYLGYLYQELDREYREKKELLKVVEELEQRGGEWKWQRRKLEDIKKALQLSIPFLERKIEKYSNVRHDESRVDMLLNETETEVAIDDMVEDLDEYKTNGYGSDNSQYSEQEQIRSSRANDRLESIDFYEDQIEELLRELIKKYEELCTLMQDYGLEREAHNFRYPWEKPDSERYEVICYDVEKERELENEGISVRSEPDAADQLLRFYPKHGDVRTISQLKRLRAVHKRNLVIAFQSVFQSEKMFNAAVSKYAEVKRRKLDLKPDAYDILTAMVNVYERLRAVGDEGIKRPFVEIMKGISFQNVAMRVEKGEPVEQADEKPLNAGKKKGRGKEHLDAVKTLKYRDMYKWLKKKESLIELLEMMAQAGYINKPENLSWAMMAEKHFVMQSESADIGCLYEMHQDVLIRWRGTEAQLCYFMEEVGRKRLIPKTQSATPYAMIEKHFYNEERRKFYNSRQIRTAYKAERRNHLKEEAFGKSIDRIFADVFEAGS